MTRLTQGEFDWLIKALCARGHEHELQAGVMANLVEIESERHTRKFDAAMEAMEQRMVAALREAVAPIRENTPQVARHSVPINVPVNRRRPTGEFCRPQLVRDTVESGSAGPGPAENTEPLDPFDNVPLGEAVLRKSFDAAMNAYSADDAAMNDTQVDMQLPKPVAAG